MPTQYLRHGGPYRPEIYVLQPQTVVPSGTTTYAVDLPPGLYQIAIMTDQLITGTTTTLDDARPYVNQAQTKTTAVTVGEFSWAQPNETGATTKTLALTGGGAEGGNYAVLFPNAMLANSGLIPLLYGFQFTFTIGTAVAGEKCVINIIATRVVG